MILTTAGNVGIGTTSPSFKLDVSGSIRASQDGAAVIIGGTSSGGQLRFGINNDNNAIVYGSSEFQIRTQQSGGITFYTSGPTFRMVVANGGNVGIGTSSPTYALDVAGTIRATGDVIAYSDARVKTNVKTIEAPLDIVTKLRGVTYNRTDIDDKSEKVGVIAQEVLEVLPQVVQQDSGGNYSVAYGNVVGVLIEAIKELKAEIEELKRNK
jgi:hypothetical protein